MPIYDYKCGSCSNKFEVKKGFTDNSIVICPKCQGQAKIVFSPVPVIFKGSGFYVTDSRGGNNNFISEPTKEKDEAEKPSVNKAEAGVKTESGSSEDD